ncbi:MAG: hypothetical protein NVSMB62_17870 [Acidobacteriaceae bacterium]
MAAMQSRFGVLSPKALVYWDARCTLLMLRCVVRFDQDEHDHWRALLECGHAIHVRHDPPWTLREWVLREESRAERIGMEMDCKRCEQEHR